MSCNFRKSWNLASAIDATDDKLVIFMEAANKSEVEDSLRERVKLLDPFLVNQYRVQIIHKAITLVPQVKRGKCKYGCKMEYYDLNPECQTATCGAFFKDEHSKIYALSSCHKNTPTNCKLVDSKGKKHFCKRASHVCQNSPLVDVVLFEVTTKKGKKAVVPVFQKPENSVLSGPYGGRNEDLSSVRETETAKKPLEVMKFGCETQLTEGTLSFYNFCNSSSKITDALIISPAEEYKKGFSDLGDCGSVIFRKDKEKRKGKEKHSRYEAVAVLCRGVNGLIDDTQCALAFRLNHAINYLVKDIDEVEKLTLMPDDQ